MFRLLLSLTLALWALSPTIAQEVTTRNITQPVKQVSAIDPAFLKLSTDNITIRKDSILNEQLVDLVFIKVADSILQSRTARHRSGFGWMLAPFGIKWKAITMKKTKYVGTAKTDIGNPDKPEYTEYDININVMAHTPKYMELVWLGQNKQKQINKKKLHGKDPNQPPFIYPTLETANQYRIHCELTPPKHYREEITKWFYPVTGHTGFKGHPNFGEPTPTVGVYGPHILDCNHNCHVEIHPYEWLWWLELNPTNDSLLNEKRWMVGLQREGSNRFRKWSKSPRTGLVSVPFLFSMDDINPTILIEHLFHNDFVAQGLKKLPELASDALDFNFKEMVVSLTNDFNPGKTLTILTNQAIDSEGIRLWLSDVQTDGKWLKGYVNIAVSVKDVYTARITVK
ncbi:hypothetical protein BH09BAC1_BH09BAC1_03560 [soil metagenome]